MNTLEDRLRDGLRAPLVGDAAESMLVRVRAGVRRRRQRRTAALVAATVSVFAGMAVAVGLFDRDSVRPEPASPPVTALTGVTDIASPDAEHVFAISAGATDRIWHWQDGAWQAGYDFPQPVSYVLFADARNGWVWGYHNLFSTHDGGQSWRVVQSEFPLTGDDTSLAATRDRVWAIGPSNGPFTSLVSSPVESDHWTYGPGLNNQASGPFATRDRVVLQQTPFDAVTPRLQSFAEGETWRPLDLPCPGENQAYPAQTAVFVLCPSADGASIHRSSDLASWQDFGTSDLASVTAVLPLADDRLVLVGEPNDLLVTPSGSEPVDLGLRNGEEIFQGTFDTVGDTTYAVTSEHRILVTRDAGLTWSQLG